MSAGIISFYFTILLLMRIDMTSGEGHNQTNSTTTTTRGPPTCHGPNMTLATYGCQCQPTCDFGLACPSNCGTYIRMAPKCVCSEQYVLDPLNFDRCIHASECQCKAPNEEFKTCAGRGPSCAYPTRNDSGECDDATASRCVCKEGYLRNSIWACVPKNSHECEMEKVITTTILPTTTPYRERIRCYNGTFFMADCSWYTDSNNSADYKKCVQYQKQRENDAFQPVLCDQGVTRCYDMRHDCYLLEGTKHVKGCVVTSSWNSGGSFCGTFRYEQCFRWMSSRFSCNECEGNLCNNDDDKSDNTKMTYSTPPIQTTRIMSLSTTHSYGDNPTTTITTTTSTTPAPTPPPKCQGPNMTLATSVCQCQPVCDFGTVCPSRCHVVQDTFVDEPLECVCAVQYVRDRYNLSRCIHASDCHCKGVNEEFKTCIECESTCAHPNVNCAKFCGDSTTSRCVCRKGYLRNAIGVCIPKDSNECVMESTTTTPSTTTSLYREKISCYNGTIFVADCSWYKNRNSNDYKKCVERQKQRENDAFQPILCDQGVTRCHDLRHKCHVSDATKHVKGCDNFRSSIPTYGICNELFFRQCTVGGDASKYRCGTCEGNLCNKDDIPYATTTTTYSSSTASYSSTIATTYNTPMMTNGRHGTTTKATTKSYHG